MIGVLVVECLLWLSERFGWRPWDQGYAVLTAVAVVGVALLVMLLWFLVSLLLRWRFQFSIRSLLVMAVVVAIPCSWFAVKIRQAKREREIVVAFKEPFVSPKWSAPSGPAWLRKLIGDDLFTHVESLHVWNTEFTNTGLENLNGLSQLQSLCIEKTKVTDAGLKTLGGLSQLRELYLDCTEVTDAGLENLKRLSQLQSLYLQCTEVTDAGLENLKGLSQLRELYLDATKVTDAGLDNLKGLRQLIKLSLDGTKVTDAGLEHLKALSQLQILRLGGTQVTDAGLENLKGLSQLRELHLYGTSVTDTGLEHLKELSRLHSLCLNLTEVTDAGLENITGLSQLQSLYIERTKGHGRRREEIPTGVAELHDLPLIRLPRSLLAVHYEHCCWLSRGQSGSIIPSNARIGRLPAFSSLT